MELCLWGKKVLLQKIPGEAGPATHGRPAKRGAGSAEAAGIGSAVLVLVLTLVAFGLVMLYSASSSAVTCTGGAIPMPISGPQLLYAAGLGAMWAASRVDYHLYHKLAWPLLGISLLLLVAVAVHAGVL